VQFASLFATKSRYNNRIEGGWETTLTLYELSVELFLVHIHNVILPKLVKDTTNADPTTEQYKSDLVEICWADMAYHQLV